MAKKIKVLVVDDSLVFRETVAKGIGGDPGIEVVGTAQDPFDARDKILELEPDVLTLDVEMPKMSGIEFLKRLMPQYPLPVVVVSAVSDNVFDALNAGAVDFVTKPDSRSARSAETFIHELIIKVKIASTAKVGHLKRSSGGGPLAAGSAAASGERIIAIGASTGGTEAIYEVIRAFPRDMPGIVVVQHMPPVFTRMYAQRLNNSCRMEVKEAETGDAVVPGRVLIAPGDRHMRLGRKGSAFVVECFSGDKVSGHCPSVDVLFHSVAEKAGPAGIGVILTGMGYDGAKGLLRMRQAGASTIGQDEASCVVYGMPKVAFDLGAVSRQTSLTNIPQLIHAVSCGKK
ncbi:MAG: chemotaxis response regulator protein-glutamate methylesterase [Negativicutes bacterium]|nr:chemotaxis response regulator protein-glutamate methylesterase [Negativicutes bacterium]